MGLSQNTGSLRKGGERRGKKAEYCAKNMLRSTDYLRRIIAPAGGQGGVTMSYLRPHCNSFLLEDHVWWVSAGKKHTSWWCAICGEKHDWRAPNRLLVVQPGKSANQAKRSSKRMRYSRAHVKTGSMRSNCWRSNKRMVISSLSPQDARQCKLCRKPKRFHSCTLPGGASFIDKVTTV